MGLENDESSKQGTEAGRVGEGRMRLGRARALQAWPLGLGQSASRQQALAVGQVREALGIVMGQGSGLEGEGGGKR